MSFTVQWRSTATSNRQCAAEQRIGADEVSADGPGPSPLNSVFDRLRVGVRMVDWLAWWVPEFWSTLVYRYKWTVSAAALSALAICAGPYLVSGSKRSAWGRLWFPPIAMWGLMSILLIIDSNQVLLVRNARTSPYVFVAGICAALAGVLVTSLSAGSAYWGGAISSRRHALLMVLSVWMVVGLFWTQAMIRLLVFEASPQ